ncbi:MAG: ankyrin repeat domain-containing protein [Deltaproteobacteria bacterium]|nr:ankyrin repeat domain-containing protein [Deltaproteobacteria bacterium]
MTRKAKVFAAVTAILMILFYFIMDAAGQERNKLVFQGETFSAILVEDPLKNVFEKIQKQTEIRFRSPESELDERVSVQFERLTVREGLRRILRTMNYSLLFNQKNKLIGVFVFGKASRTGKAGFSAELDEQIVKAAMERDTAKVTALLDRGANVNAKGKYSGWTPLMLAARKGDTELLNLLLSHGADVNAKSPVQNRTALMEAVRNRKIEAAKALLAAYPDVDAVDWEGYTVLMFAAVSGQRDSVNVLLAHGADVNVKNKVGSSALMMASGYPKVSEQLKEAGAVE